jgi:Class II Aldolase and Adducin N-terminal domain
MLYPIVPVIATRPLEFILLRVFTIAACPPPGEGLHQCLLILGGGVRFDVYGGTPGTWELCARLDLLVRKFDAVLLENHGVVTCGPDLNAAYNRMETVEQCALVMLTAELLGGPHLLPRAEVQKLIAGRTPRVSGPGEKLGFAVSEGRKTRNPDCGTRNVQGDSPGRLRGWGSLTTS